MEPCTSRRRSKGCWERAGSARIPCPPKGGRNFGRRRKPKGGWREAAWAGGAATAPLEVTSASPESYIMHVACFVPPRLKSSSFALSHGAGLLLLGSYRFFFFFKKSFKTAFPHSSNRVKFYFIRSQFVLIEVFLKEAYTSSAFMPLNPNCNLDDRLRAEGSTPVGAAANSHSKRPMVGQRDNLELTSIIKAGRETANPLLE